MTQKQKLLNLLYKKEWVCTTDFQENYIPEFRSLIAHMRKHEGYGIVDESCLGRCGKKHDSKGLKRWKLLHNPNDSQIVKEFRDEYKQRTENRTKQLNSRDTVQEGQGMLTLR